MTAREIICLNEDIPRLEAPQSGDTYLFPRAATLADLPNAFNSGDYPVQLLSGISDSGTAKGFIFDTVNDLDTQDAEPFVFRNAGTDLFKARSVDFLGIFKATGIHFPLPITAGDATLDTFALAGFPFFGIDVEAGSAGTTPAPALSFIARKSSGAATVPTALQGIVTQEGTASGMAPKAFFGEVQQGGDNAFIASNPAVVAHPTVFTSFISSGTGDTGSLRTISNYTVMVPSFLGGKPTDIYGYSCANQGLSGITNAYAIYLLKQSGATNNAGIVLDGDGIGSDILFGDGQDARIFYDGTDLIIDPDVVGSGSLKITGQVVHDEETVYTSLSLSISAAGGITPVKTLHRIAGDGGPIDITADPQIAAGTDGQILILEGGSDSNTVQLDTGNGVHLHEDRAIFSDMDMMTLHYNAIDSAWHEISRNFSSFTIPFPFASPSGGSGTFYEGGFYEFGSTDNDFNPSITFGTANESHAAHFFLVQAAGGAGGTDTVIRITATSIDDQGNRTTTDTEDLTVDDAGSAGDYYETSKKWIGQITIAKQSGPDLLMNYGIVKYWDNNNNDFRVLGVDVSGRAGANDTAPNISLIHHKATGWTYNAGASPIRPTAIANMDTDHSIESEFINGDYFSWKRDNLNISINGNNGEGIVIEWITTANKSVETSSFILRVRPD